MIYTVEINDEEVMKKFREVLDEQVTRGLNDAVSGYRIRELIRDKVEALIAADVDKMLLEKLKDSPKELEAKVDNIITSMLKSKVKKAMK